MPDAPYLVLCQQNDIDRVPAARTQRRRPKTTLMDCVLRTPLKGPRQSRHDPVTGTPVTPPSVRLEKKRKFRSASSSLNENIAFEPFATTSTKRNGHGGGRRSSIVRRINSEPSSLIQARNVALYPASACSEHNESSTCRPTKRLRVNSLQTNPNDDLLMQEHGGEENLGRNLRRLHLDEPKLLTGDGHVCESSHGCCSCQQLMIRMRECLEIERKARQNAEERHLVELQKRLDMERLVETLQSKLLSRIN